MGHRSKRYRAATACRIAQDQLDAIDRRIELLALPNARTGLIRDYMVLSMKRQEIRRRTFQILFPTDRHLRMHERQAEERELSRARFLERPARPKRQNPPHRIAKLLKDRERFKAGQA